MSVPGAEEFIDQDSLEVVDQNTNFNGLINLSRVSVLSKL